jgi:DNA-directed RNA polymerase I, II, and III subunit RPABC5
MIIPIRCFTCNNVLAGKWLTYLEKVKEHAKKEGIDEEISYLTHETKKSPHGKALDDVGITKECCRTRMLTHVDLM